MNCGNEEHVLRDDEMTDIDGTNHEEAPSDADVVMLGVITSSVVICHLYMVLIACFIHVRVHGHRMKHMCVY